MRAQGLPDEEIMRARPGPRQRNAAKKRTRSATWSTPSMPRTGKIRWEREAHRRVPHGGRHRKNTYASETPFTDGERLYASFGQNVGLFCYSLTGNLLWKKQWPPQPIYLDFGTASSPVVHDGRVYLLHDSEARVVHHRARRENRRGAVAHRRAEHRPAAVVLDHAVRLAARPAHRDRDDRTRVRDRLRPGRRRAVAGQRDVDADGGAVRRQWPAVCRHRLAGRREPAVHGDPPGRERRHHAEADAKTATRSSSGAIRARPATRRRRWSIAAAPISSTTPASWWCSTR